MLAADAAWPGCGRIACSSGRNGRSEPSIASIASAAVTSAMVNRCRASSMASSSMPSMPSVPLISASPSLAASSIGRSPAACSASAAGDPGAVLAEHPALAHQHQRAVRQRGQVAGGAQRAVLGHPRCDVVVEQVDQCLGDHGRTPEWPIASDRTRSSIIARTTSRGIGAPIPAACERISECCSSARRSGATNVLASAPNPVETP